MLRPDAGAAMPAGLARRGTPDRRSPLPRPAGARQTPAVRAAGRRKGGCLTPRQPPPRGPGTLQDVEERKPAMLVEDEFSNDEAEAFPGMGRRSRKLAVNP